ncbi:hypothetical protein [Labilithrix luteola]|uniref:hypothetical protein n=1 Tax=Labilithrix luteola TaxID=1391654 RepID=UPI0011BA626D|nr:hypothetical protein [Labilithrix luteola]
MKAATRVGLTFGLVVSLGVAAVAACSSGSLPAPTEDGGAQDSGSSGTSGSSGSSGTPGDSGTSGTPQRDASAARECSPECLRNTVCRAGDCTGPVTSDGCCNCLPGEVDEATCNVDASSHQ